MNRLFPFALLALLALPGYGGAADDDADDYSPFPTFVWIDALGEAPAEYSYWEVARRRSGRFSFGFGAGETGAGSPSVTRIAYGPGEYYEVFYFYDEEGRIVGSASGCARVDEYGMSTPCDMWYDDWRRRGHWSNRNLGSFDSAGAEKSLYEYEWPDFELAVVISGSGPWTAECTTSGNMPDKWILSFEWDLNYDHDFNRTTGRSPQLVTTLTLPGKYIFSVRATDLRGYTTVAQCEFTVGVQHQRDLNDSTPE